MGLGQHDMQSQYGDTISQPEDTSLGHVRGLSTVILAFYILLTFSLQKPAKTICFLLNLVSLLGLYQSQSRRF